MVDVFDADGEVFFGLVGEEEGHDSAGLEGGGGVARELVKEGDPIGKGEFGDAFFGVTVGVHGVVGRVAEHEVAVEGFGWVAAPYVMLTHIGTYRLDVIREAFATHCGAYVDGGAAARHGVDDPVAGLSEVVEGVGDDGGGDCARIGDTEGGVWAEGPDIVGGGFEIGGEAIAAAEVFVGGVDGFLSAVEKVEGGERAGVVGLRGAPDGTGLAVEVFAAEADGEGDALVGSARGDLFVGIPTNRGEATVGFFTLARF